MPSLVSDPSESLVPFSPQVGDPVVYPLRHGLKPPFARLSISWSRGNSLRVAFFKTPAAASASSDDETGGKVLEVKLAEGGGEIDEAQRRRIAYESVPVFAHLQMRRNSADSLSRMSYGSSSYRAEW